MVFNEVNAAFAWAVHSGNVGAAAPEPAAAWLFCSALGLLGWIRRRRAHRIAVAGARMRPCPAYPSLAANTFP